MAVPKGPHLLSLPREIRDEIYQYLSQEINLRWGRCEETRDYWNQATVCLRNVPMSSVLLTSAQLYEEYLQALRLQQLSVTINIGVYSSLHISDGEPKKLAEDPVVERIFARVPEVTVVFDHDYDSYGMWRDVHDLFNNLGSKLPHLSTIRVMAQYSDQYTEMYWSEDLSQIEKFWRPPMKSVLEFPLRQRGAGYFWDYWGESDQYFPGQLSDRRYVQHTIGVWLYSKDESNEACVLPMEYYNEQTVKRPSPEDISTMPEDEAEIAGRIGLGFELWKEVGGKDLLSWGPLDENLRGYGGSPVQF